MAIYYNPKVESAGKEVTVDKAIENLGGFVRDRDTKQQIKSYLKNIRPTVILIPKKISETKSVQKSLHKFIQLSVQNNWPIVSSKFFDDVESGNLKDFTLNNYIWKHRSVVTCQKISSSNTGNFSQKMFWSSGYKRLSENKSRRKKRRSFVNNING